MKWYAVHIVEAINRIDDVGEICVDEEIVVLTAESDDHARNLAEKFLNKTDNFDESIEIDGVKAKRITRCVRKIVHVFNNDCEQHSIVDETEISYLQYNLKTVNDLQNLLKLEATNISFIE